MQRGFLLERLEKARSLPPEQRSPEVAAFVETCQLQQEIEELLGLPPAPSRRANHERQLLVALKLVRCVCLSPPGGLAYSESVIEHAVRQVAGRAGVIQVGSMGPRLAALLETDNSLLMLLQIAAALGECGPPRSERAGLLAMANSTVQRLRRQEQEVRRQLEEAQAQLPRPLVTYEQLTAFFVLYAGLRASEVLYIAEQGDLCARLDAVAVADASKACSELIPQLAPDIAHLQYFGASLGMLVAHRDSFVQQARDGLLATMQLAQRQGSDFAIALCGYDLAKLAPDWASGVEPSLREACRPSEFLGWLRRAREAHRRCAALLPAQWTMPIKGRQAVAREVQPWLEQLQRQGDCWQAFGASHTAKLLGSLSHLNDETLRQPGALFKCSACGKTTAQLKLCSGCKGAAQYCSKECQLAHWPTHKPACKSAQQSRKASGSS